MNYVGEAIALVALDDRYIAEDAVGRIRSTTSSSRRSSGSTTRAPRSTSSTRTCPATSAPASSRTSATRRPRSPPPRTGWSWTSPSSAAPACRWRSARSRGGTPTPTECRCGPPRRPRPACAAVAVKLGLDLGQVDVITPDVGGGFGVKINHPWPEELLVPLAARALGRTAKFTEQPARALHLVRARARPGPPCRGGRVRRRRPAGRAQRGVLARPRRLLAVRPDRPHHRLDPAARPLQAAQRPGRLRVDVHEHGHGDAVPRRRPAAGLLHDGAHDGRHRGVPRQGPCGGQGGQLHSAGRVPVRPRPDLPGRPRAGVRLRRLPDLAGEDQEAGRLGRLPYLPEVDGRVQGRKVGIGPGVLRRGHRRGSLRGRARPHRDDRQGEGRDRPDHAGQGHATVVLRSSSPTSRA